MDEPGPIVVQRDIPLRRINVAAGTNEHDLIIMRSDVPVGSALAERLN